MGNPYDNASTKVSVLGPTLTFKGELSAEEDLLLRGRVEGSVQHSASLRIGEGGSIKGDVTARHVAVEGQVEGDIHGSQSVTVKSSAQVTGNIYSPNVSLMEGAHFRGGIDMGQAPGRSDAEPSQEASPDSSNGPAQKVAAGSQ